MARPNWEYIRVDVNLPDHPKLDGLTYAAKWTLLELWLECGKHLTDGFIRDARWRKFGTAHARRLLVERGLAHRVPGGYQVHDYLDHQRSRAEVIELQEKRRSAGAKGGRAKAHAVALAKQEPEQVSWQNSGKSVAEAEAEAEADRSVVDVGDQSSARTPPDAMTDMIIKEVKSLTGHDIPPEHAAAIYASLTHDREVSNPAAYVRQAIRSERDHRRWLPATALQQPWARSPGEAALAAGLTPNGRPVDEEAKRAIAAQARQAITNAKETP